MCTSCSSLGGCSCSSNSTKLPMGPKGATGATGEAGPKGDTGDKGTSGVTVLINDTTIYTPAASGTPASIGPGYSFPAATFKAIGDVINIQCVLDTSGTTQQKEIVFRLNGGVAMVKLTHLTFNKTEKFMLVNITMTMQSTTELLITYDSKNTDVFYSITSGVSFFEELFPVADVSINALAPLFTIQNMDGSPSETVSAHQFLATYFNIQ